MSNMKGKIALMTSALSMNSYCACTAIVAQVVEAFPDTSLQLIQGLTVVPNIVAIFAGFLTVKLTPYILKKYLLIFSGLIVPIAGLAIYFYHPNVQVMLVLTALMGICTGVRSTCIPGLICDCYSQKESGRLIGMQCGFICAGAMIFTWVAGQLAKDNWENCYLCYIISFAIILIEILFLPKGKLETRENTKSERQPVPKSILGYMIMAFVFGVTIWIFNSTISLLVDVRGFGGTVESSYASICYNITGIVAGCLSGFIIAKVKRLTFSLGLLLGAIGTIICFFSMQFGMLCVGAVFCGAAFSIVLPAGNYYASFDASDSNRTLCLSLFNNGTILGIFLSPTIFNLITNGGYIPERFLISGSTLAIVGIVVTFLSILFMRKTNRL